MGNNHSNNDYRPDPTRADRIRGSSDKPESGGARKKNGFRPQVSASPSHSQGPAPVAAFPVVHGNLRGRVVVALYTYQGSEFGDMTFTKGDQMEIVDDTDPDWWVARHTVTGETGHIPRNYVALQSSIESEE